MIAHWGHPVHNLSHEGNEQNLGQRIAIPYKSTH